MKSCTLNEFYLQAKELLKKYQCVKDCNRLQVAFELNDDNSGGIPELQFQVGYFENTDNSEKKGLSIYIIEPTPDIAILKLESELMRLKNIPLTQDFSINHEQEL
jgi:hypothetical protein